MFREVCMGLFGAKQQWHMMYHDKQKPKISKLITFSGMLSAPDHLFTLSTHYEGEWNMETMIPSESAQSWDDLRTNIWLGNEKKGQEESDFITNILQVR